MSFEEDEESFEHTLLVVREVSVYKIPPRSTSGGYKCGEWLQTDKIWTGRLRVVSCNSRCEIRLEDPTSGDLFAACSVLPGHREAAVEPALDSSRYFVLRIEDGSGKHAFVGLGFSERNEAFDFNVALSDHEKHVLRESDEAGGGDSGAEDAQIGLHPAVNHRLKEGETIRINVKHKPTSGSGMLSAAGLSSGLSDTTKPKTLGLAPPPSGAGKIRSPLPPPPKTLGLAPPPSGTGKIRSPLPPPPNDPATVKLTSGLKGSSGSSRDGSDPLSDFSKLERNLPTTAGSGSAKSSAAGWAAF